MSVFLGQNRGPYKRAALYGCITKMLEMGSALERNKRAAASLCLKRKAIAFSLSSVFFSSLPHMSDIGGKTGATLTKGSLQIGRCKCHFYLEVQISLCKVL